MELSYVYHPDVIFFMETKVNPNRADDIIKRHNHLYPFHIKVPSTGFAGRLWVCEKLLSCSI